MNVKDASERWHVTEKTVREYCKEGIIPEAYKQKKSVKSLIYEEWNIPSIDRPPVRRAGLVRYMLCIISINEGAKPKFSRECNEVKQIYKYLSDSGFITEWKSSKDIVKSLRGVSITSLGNELIKKENPSISSEITSKIGANLGLINSEVSVTKKMN